MAIARKEGLPELQGPFFFILEEWARLFGLQRSSPCVFRVSSFMLTCLNVSLGGEDLQMYP